MQQNAQRHKVYHRGRLEGNRYIFSNDSDEDGDSGEEEHAMKLYKQEPVLERELQPGDTLQTLALQFNCPIAELKRLNNIHRDNEIFARRTVKVPARLFTKKLPGVHAGSSHKAISEGRDTCTSSESLTDVSNDVSVSSPVPAIELLVCAVTRTVLEGDPAVNFNVECSTSPLIPPEDSSLTKEKKSMYGCNGADWGLSWLQLLICSLLLGFAGPILYVIIHN